MTLNLLETNLIKYNIINDAYWCFQLNGVFNIKRRNNNNNNNTKKKKKKKKKKKYNNTFYL